ncbi:MAG: hypothetical protein QOD90_4585 [Mycobacterium sp.]|jgi:hypothetical protein|nr:hypothetical protein [Mycobacterium sp.]
MTSPDPNDAEEQEDSSTPVSPAYSTPPPEGLPDAEHE